MIRVNEPGQGVWNGRMKEEEGDGEGEGEGKEKEGDQEWFDKA